jgi:cbb3-type cytochrome oxidase maturation protein
MMVAIALFAAGVAMGTAGALIWAWGIHAGQFEDLEAVKDQLFWPELASEGEPRAKVAEPSGGTR